MVFQSVINNYFMNKLLSLFFIALTAVLFYSCESSKGDWEPMKIENKEISFTAKGGCAIATVTNYGGWWICNAHEYSFVNNSWAEVACVEYGNDAITLSKDFDMLSGNWFRAYVPRSNKNLLTKYLVVIVDENNTGTSRRISIRMECMNVFSTVSVEQKAK